MFLGVGWQTDPHIWRQGETEKRGKTTTYWKVSLLIHKGIYMGGLSWMVIRQADLYLFMSENLRSYRGLSWVHSHTQSRWSQQHLIISSLPPWKRLQLWGWCCLVAQLCLTLQPHVLQQARFPCPSPSPRACSKLLPLSGWCHPTILSSVIPFSSCLLSFPHQSFPMIQLFVLGGQIIGAAALASVFPMNIQGWFPLGWTKQSDHMAHSLV